MITRWTWSPAKSQSNLAKHGVAFDVAARIFDDPLQATRLDTHLDGDRLQTIGRPFQSRATLVLVVHTEPKQRGEIAIGRIISARKANPAERRKYEEDDF